MFSLSVKPNRFKYPTERRIKAVFPDRFLLFHMKTKRKIIVIVSSLLLLALIGLAFAVTKHNKGETLDNPNTTRSYVEKMYQTIPELPPDFDYYTIARREVIKFYTEGITDKEKLIHKVLNVVVNKLEVEGTEYDLAPWQKEKYEKEIKDSYERHLFMKDLIESKGLDYNEVTESRSQVVYEFMLMQCAMMKWYKIEDAPKKDSGITGQDLAKQINELQEKKIEQLHKELNRKYHFDRQIEELFVEIFGEDYEHKKYDAWYLDAIEKNNREMSEEAKLTEEATTKMPEETVSVSNLSGIN